MAQSHTVPNPSHPPDHVLVSGNPGRFGVELGKDGELCSDGVPLREIASAVGTPAYVYSASHVAHQYQSLVRALQGGRPTLVCYAVKANSNQALLGHLGRLGAGADIVSGGELARVLAAGIPGERIVYSGVGKTSAEIDAALAANIKAIHLESGFELDHVRARAREAGRTEPVPVALRVNPDIDPETHPYLATGLEQTKFGIPMGDAPGLALAAAKAPELRLVGLTCHIGSQIMNAGPFLDSLARIRPLIDGLARDHGVTLDYLDLGGGLGIPYSADDEVVDTERFGRAIVDATAGLELDLLLEPGRFLVGNGGVMLTRVLGVKRGSDRNFLIVDAAMNDLIRPALYGAYHAIVPAVMPSRDAACAPVDVVGPICECGDFIARARPLPTGIAAGDVLAVLGSGAYAMTMASTYNSRPRAPEVVARAGRFAVTRRRRTIEELIAEEEQTAPDWLREPVER